MSSKAAAIIMLFIAFTCARANASILSGSVSFDSVNNLYTYSYALDNTSGPSPINELAILIDTAGPAFLLEPVATTSPAGWFFTEGSSGSVANPPLNEFGAFWAWRDGAVDVGDTLNGFSFTTPEPPASSTINNNYFLWASAFTGGPPCCYDVLEYGNIVAPDFAPYVDPPYVPEPQTWLMVSAGALVLLTARRKGLFHN